LEKSSANAISGRFVVSPTTGRSEHPQSGDRRTDRPSGSCQKQEAPQRWDTVLYTILQSAKLNGLNPEVYLADVIDRMTKGHPINRLSELLPWNWKQKDNAPNELESAAAG
jgi:IS66 C-terminal element